MVTEKPWCKLHIVIDCGSLSDVINVLNRIVDSSGQPPTVHENTISLVEIKTEE